LNWLYATCISYSGWNDPGSASVDTLSIGSTASGYNSEGINTKNRMILKLRIQSGVVLIAQIHAKAVMSLLGPTAL
jgi:hypothetical protein